MGSYRGQTPLVRVVRGGHQTAGMPGSGRGEGFTGSVVPGVPTRAHLPLAQRSTVIASQKWLLLSAHAAALIILGFTVYEHSRLPWECRPEAACA